jgi:hypothetical protein
MTRLLSWLLSLLRRPADTVSAACLAQLQAMDQDHLLEPTGSREWRPERGDPAKREAYTEEVPK